MTAPLPSSAGFCTRCRTTHTLQIGPAKEAALRLIEQLDREKRLDFPVPVEKADPRFSTDYLFGKARGKMFGVMVCRCADGSLLTLKSFSGQYNGEWELEGWAPPLFDLKQWHSVNHDSEKEIKSIGARIDAVGRDSIQGKSLIQKRIILSRDLMKELHRLYALFNFRSQRRPLTAAFTGGNGIPNGTADCCGPKLLNLAARKKLLPLGLAEFFYGRTNRKGSRHHGRLYPSCSEKCAPILGFMLCGLDDGMSPRTE